MSTSAIPLRIAGALEPGATSAPIHAPFDDRLVDTVGLASATQVDAAITAGHDAAAAMRAWPTHARRAALFDVADALAAKADAFASCISAEAGKPITLARGEVARAQQTFRFAAEELARGAGETVPLDAVPNGDGRFGIVKRVAVGVTSAITPFNFPLNLVAHKLAPALAAGCPTVLKPAPQAPLTSLMLGDVVADAVDKHGGPTGALSVVPCAVENARALVEDERIKLLSFTGSARVGWHLKNTAGKKKTLLELGGDAAVVVCHDADVEAAAARIAWAAFVYAGQVCISVQRILVDARVFDAFKRAFVDAVAAIRCGSPDDESVICGPLIDAANKDRVLSWVQDAEDAGASVTVRGGVLDGDAGGCGNVLTPFVLENVPDGTRLSCDEVFGPVCSLSPFTTLDDAFNVVNASPYGLQAGVYTNDVRNVWHAFDALEVGAVIHNDVPTYRVDHMPYGGVKDSGFGREGLKYAIADYTEPRLLALRP